MTTQFDRNLTSWRFVTVNFGDTLQDIAARELRDASRWVDLVNINGLTPPFLTDDPSKAGPTVKLYGQLIIVPTGSPQVTTIQDPDAVFGTDCLLDNNGDLIATAGDIATVTGRANLRQALEDVIETERGELLFHLDYGCDVRKLVGKANGPTAGLVGAAFVKAAVQADPRIQSIVSAQSSVTGDVLAVQVTAVPISGTPIDVSASP